MVRGAEALHFDTQEGWLDSIRDWAQREPRVVRVWVFGSRATGRRRPKHSMATEPDLDIAYELVQVRSDETTFTANFFRKDGWKASLQASLPVALDLQFMITDEPDAQVPIWVAEHGVLIWERDSSSSSPVSEG